MIYILTDIETKQIIAATTNEKKYNEAKIKLANCIPRYHWIFQDEKNFDDTIDRLSSSNKLGGNSNG